MPDKLEILHQNASQHFDIGTLDEFKQKMLIPEKRRIFFDNVSTIYDIGDFETYEQKLAPLVTPQGRGQYGFTPEIKDELISPGISPFGMQPRNRIDDLIDRKTARREEQVITSEQDEQAELAETTEIDDLVRMHPDQYKAIRGMQKAEEPIDIIELVTKQAVVQAASTQVKKPEERLEKAKKEPIKPMPISPYGMLPVGEKELDISGIPEATGKGLLSGLTQTAGTVGTALQYTGGKTGVEFLEKAGKETHEYWEREGEKYVAPEELQGSIIDNPKLLNKGAWWAYNVAQMTPSFAAALVPAVGTAKYVNILGKTMKWTTPTFIRLARLAPSIVGGTAGGVIEGTNTYQEILDKGGTKDEAEAGMEMMTLAAGALNAISFSRMTKNMPKGLEKSLLSYLERGGTEAFTEWLEEPSEGMIKMSLGHATWEDVKEQSLQGINVMPPAFIMGVGGTAVSARMEAVRAGKQPIITEEDTKLRDDVVKAYNEFVEVSGEPETKKITSFEDIDADVYKKMLAEPPLVQKPPIEAVKPPEAITLPKEEKVPTAPPVKAVEEVKAVPEKMTTVEIKKEFEILNEKERVEIERLDKLDPYRQVVDFQHLTDEEFIRRSDLGNELQRRESIEARERIKRKKAEKPAVKEPTPEQIIAQKKEKRSIAGRKAYQTRIKGKIVLKENQITELMAHVAAAGNYRGELGFFEGVLVKKGITLKPFVKDVSEETYDMALEDWNEFVETEGDLDLVKYESVEDFKEAAFQDFREVEKGKSVEDLKKEELKREQYLGYTKAEAEAMEKYYPEDEMEQYNKSIKESGYAEEDIGRIESDADKIAKDEVEEEILRTEGKEEFDEKTYQETLKFFADKVKPPAVEEGDALEYPKTEKEADQRYETQALSAKTWDIKLPIEPETTEKINKTELLQWTEKAFGVPIKGKATHKWKSAGIYYPQKQIVRMRTWGELAVMTHEVAHHLDYKMNDVLGKDWRRQLGAKGGKKILVKELADLDYNQNPKSGLRTREGFAEFMRYYLTTDMAKEKAPNFYDVFTNKFLKERPEIADKINSLKEKMDVWQLQGAENRIIAQIDYKGEHVKIRGIRNKYERAKAWTLKNWNDEFYYPQKVVRKIEKITGKKLRPSENPAALMEYGKSKAGFIARTFVMDKAVDESGNIVGKGLVDILKPLEHDKVKTFISYAVAKRALLKESQGKESGIDIEDAKYIVDKYKNDTWDKIITEITEWSDHLLDWVVRAGGLGSKEADIIRKMNPIYLPFKRAFIDELIVMKGGVGKIADRGQAIKRMKGSGRPIVNPIESLIGTATEMISKAQKIRIASAWAKLAKEKGVGGFITEVPAPMQAKTVRVSNIKDFEQLLVDVGAMPEGLMTDLNMDKLATVFFQNWQYMGKDNIVSLWVDGKRKFYELHPELYRALKGMDAVQINNIGWLLMAKTTRMLRLGATGLKISFGFGRNPFRDAFTYAVFSQNKGARVWDPAEGLYKEITAKPGDLLWRFKKTGGSLSGMIGYDRAATMTTYDDMLLELLGKKGKVLKIVKHPVNTIRDILSLTELAPRSMEIENSYERHLKENPDWTEEDAYIAAFNDAQDVTINFTKSGYISKRINEVVAFHNVAIRGPEKVYRSFRDNPIRTIIRGLGWLTVFAMMNHWRNKDKDWYKNLPPAYKYNNYFIGITDNIIVRLPIPFDLGILFSAVPMAAMDTMLEKDPQYIKGLMEQIKMNIPPLTPDIIGPIVDVATNKNWIGTPIESKGMKYDYPTKRARHYTSLMAKKLSKGFDEIGISLSPIQIDYMLNSYTGGFKQQIPGRKIFEPADIPVIGDFFLRMPQNPRRQLNNFYSEYELLSQKKKSDIASKVELAKLDDMQLTYRVLAKKFKKLKTAMNVKDVDIDEIREIYREMQEELEIPSQGRPKLLKKRKIRKLGR